VNFLSKFRPGRQDLLVLDLALPGMKGCDLLEKIDKEKYQLPVIVITASDDAKDLEFCKKFGVKAYLRKPVDGGALLDIIKFNTSS
jgi:CheY-like chemotaxis protein